MHLPEKSTSEYETTPAGTHLAICYRFVDLGTHPSDYQGQTKYKRLVLLGFELPNELMEDGRPFTASKRYTWSMHEKATLRHDLEAWRGVKFTDADFGPGGFDIRNILGKPCTISIIHDEKDGKTYTNIASIGQVMKGMQVPQVKNELIYVSLMPEYFERDSYESLSDGLKKKIQESPEWADLLSKPQDQIKVHQEPDPARDVRYETPVYDDRNPPPMTDAEIRSHPF